MLAWPVSHKMAMARLRRLGHHAGPVAGADLGAVLVIDDIADLLQGRSPAS
jgi:hypothetical protein